jgi:hypothetical protein
MIKYSKFLFFFSLTNIFCSLGLFAKPIVTTLDRIIINTEGIYVNIEGNCQPIESLTMANDGYVVAIPRLIAEQCPNCGSSKYTPGRFCRVCGFPNDSKLSKNTSDY